MLRVLVADDHEIVRRGVRGVIVRHADWEVCGEAGDGSLALELALNERPDVAVIAVSMPGLNGIALTRRLSEALPALRVLLFSMHNDDETVTNGLLAGARGYLVKTDSCEQLETAISALGANQPYVSPRVSQSIDDKRGRVGRLTARELEVVQLIADGQTNRKIAGSLVISVKTVEAHRTAVMEKVGAHNASELVRFAVKHRLIQP